MIELRLITESDIEDVRRWRNSDLIKNVSYNQTDITKEEQQIWYSHLKDNPTQIHWIISVDDKNIGYSCLKGIDLRNKRVEFASLYIGEEDYLLSGLGASAEYKVLEYIYNEFDVNKVFCEVLSFNKKVIQLHKRFGFVEEGILKNHYFINNKFEDVHLLALFRENWFNNKEKILKILKI